MMKKSALPAKRMKRKIPHVPNNICVVNTVTLNKNACKARVLEISDTDKLMFFIINSSFTGGFPGIIVLEY